MSRGMSVFVLSICMAVAGCGQSGDPVMVQEPADGPSPDQVVAAFLEAVRTGDDQAASDLLTPLARQKTEEMHMVVAPPGSETARYAIREVEYVGDKAHVAAEWTDLDTDGRPHTDLIVWVLRKDTQGWRISGMTTRVFADMDPVVLNFEDPADMVAKQQQAEEEISRREQQFAQPMAAEIPSSGPVR